MNVVDLPPIRQLLQPDPGSVLVEGDLERADAQFVAWYADEPELKQLFQSGHDIYVEEARWVYSDPTLAANSPERQRLKAACHLSNYGGKARTLAQTLGTTVLRAEQFQRRWFDRFPGILHWHTKVQQQLQLTRQVKNIWGFRRFYFDRIDGQILPQALAWLGQCLPLACEVLTKHGWQSIEKTACCDDDIAVWDSKTRVIKFEVPGRWVRGRSRDFLRMTELGYDCTLNHKIPFYNSRGNFNSTPAQYISERDQVPRNGYFFGGDVFLSAAQVTVLAAFQADGWYDEKRDALQFEFRKSRKINRLEDALIELKADYTKSVVRRGATMFYIKQGASLVDPKWKQYRSWLLDFSAITLDLLLSEIGHWDGSIEPDCDVTWYFQNDKESCDWIATIASLRGGRPRWFSRPDDGRRNEGYRLTYTFAKGKNSKTKVSRVSLDDPIDVACPTVSTGYFLVRSNGQISVTGNSGTTGAINHALLRIHRELPDVQLLLQIHDSVLCQVPADRADELLPRILATMHVIVPFPDPLTIPVSLKWSAENWGSMVKWQPPTTAREAA